MKDSWKYQIAEIIGRGCFLPEKPSYDQIISTINDDVYKCIYKVPVVTFIMGTLESFIIKDLDHANVVLNLIKEVTQDCLESSGFELTYTDRDWIDLKVINNPSQYGNRYMLSKHDLGDRRYNDKVYMSEFFEF